MRKVGVSLAFATIALASVASLRAATLAGVTLPDTVQGGSTDFCSMAWDRVPSSR
jgi:hypothetical protein